MHRYFVSYMITYPGGGFTFGNAEHRRTSPVAGHEDVAGIADDLVIGNPPGTTIVITNFIPFGDPEHARPMLSANDVEQLVADTESKIDDAHPLDAEPALNDLLKRLRRLAGLDDPYPAANDPMTIGRSDRCLIEAPHDASLCGKHEAHR